MGSLGLLRAGTLAESVIIRKVKAQIIALYFPREIDDR
jgi:hypothetical protein